MSPQIDIEQSELDARLDSQQVVIRYGIGNLRYCTYAAAAADKRYYEGEFYTLADSFSPITSRFLLSDEEAHLPHLNQVGLVSTV